MARKRSLDVERLRDLVRSDAAVGYLQAYYGSGLEPGDVPAFTGARFEFLGGGGDRECTADSFTASDLLAVELLSVQVPGRVALDLLEGRLGQRAAELLAQIGTSLTLWDIPGGPVDVIVRKGGPAEELWSLLEGQVGIGWVTAGKLLARKRPSLIPVYDEIVRCAFGRPEKFWVALRDGLLRDDGKLADELTNLRYRAEIPQDTRQKVTLLRVLDVVVWMHHRNSHRSTGCLGLR
jgi:hypothetical protein